MANKKKSPESYDLKERYPIFVKRSLFTTLLVFIALFLLSPKYEPHPYKLKKKVTELKMENVAQEVKKINEPPPPVKKKVAPKLEESNDADEDVDIASTTFNADEPPAEESEEQIYRYFEKPPQPVVNVEPEYPDVAKQLGLEGTVILELVIEKDGHVSRVKDLKSVHPLLDDAAKKAAYRMKFTPAYNKDMPVRCYATWPVRFALERLAPASIVPVRSLSERSTTEKIEAEIN